MVGNKTCLNCTIEYPIVAKRDLERSKFCSRKCLGEWTAKQRGWDGKPFNFKEYKKEWDSKNQDKIQVSRDKWWNSSGKSWYSDYMKTDAYKLSALKTRLKSRYNLTLDQYLDMYIAQEGRCKICGLEKASATDFGSNINDTICVDHDPLTQKVRGLLCRQCNAGIGNLKHSSLILRKAIKYLEIGDD